MLTETQAQNVLANNRSGMDPECVGCGHRLEGHADGTCDFTGCECPATKALIDASLDGAPE